MSDKEKLPAANQTQEQRQEPVDLNTVKEEVSAVVGKQQKPPRDPPKKDKSFDGRKPGRGGGDSYSRCLMFFPTSGHMGFEIIKSSAELPPIDVVRQMVSYDVQLRLSEPIQNLIEKYHHDEAIIT